MKAQGTSANNSNAAAAAAADASPAANDDAVMLQQLLGGGGVMRDADARARQRQQMRLARSNDRHAYSDVVVGAVVYSFSTLQLLAGQSNALSLLSLWLAGTGFFVSYAQRRYLRLHYAAMAPPTTAAVAGQHDDSGAVAAAAAVQTAAMTAVDPRTRYQMETVSSWVWLLTSTQQFRTHKLLRWSGYSSWCGLLCAAYYSTRHLYTVYVT